MTFIPGWTHTPRLQRQINAIERTVGFLEHVRLRPESTAKLHLRARVADALASVQIEGNRLTIKEAFRLARARPDDPTLGDDAREFLNYLDAFEAIDHLRDLREQRPGIGDLLNVHRMVVRGVRGGDRFAGQLRREEVSVGDRAPDGSVTVHHQPPHWSQVDDELRELMTWTNDAYQKPAWQTRDEGGADPWIHPVIVAGIAQHRLAWIHPFVDGNGRTARMWTTLLLYGRGYDFKYLFVLSSYYNENRDAYYAALRATDQTGDYTRWLEYFAGGLARQMYRIRERAIEGAEAGPAAFDPVPASAPSKSTRTG